jgi:membrane peptidoglycan carboxypeptidase
VQIAACVWIGYVEGEIPLENVEGVPLVFGGTIPAAIWQDFMTIAMDGRDPESFVTPSFVGYTLGPELPAYSPTPDPCALPSGSSEVPCPSQSPSPSPEPTGSPSPEPTMSPSPTESPSLLPSPSPSPEPTGSPTPTGSPLPTESPKPKIVARGG